jgi:hypothetical protein
MKAWTAVIGACMVAVWTPGPPAEMVRLQPLIGEWRVALSTSSGKSITGARPFTISQELGGTTVVMRGAYPGGSGPEISILVLLCYDRFNHRYRMAVADDYSAQLDIYEGTLEENRLVLDNLRANTFIPDEAGKPQHVQAQFTLEKDHFTIATRGTVDGGRTWSAPTTLKFVRR